MFEDAKYLRAQAVLCLEIARSISSRADAENMRVRAFEYNARAERLEPTGDDAETQRPK
jgi:hypothetical protein